MRYHHLGIPTTQPQPGETYLAQYKTFCTDHERNPLVMNRASSSESATGMASQPLYVAKSGPVMLASDRSSLVALGQARSV